MHKKAFAPQLFLAAGKAYKETENAYMKQKRQFPWVMITKKGEKSVRSAHPWVYSDEITQKSEIKENGCLVDVLSEKGAYLGTGFYSEKSKIRVRILSDNPNEAFTEAFWRRRVEYALNYRKLVMGADYPRCCRIIFGEADGFPGLTIDRYGDLLVSEVLSYGTNGVIDIIYRALCEAFAEQGFPVEGIYERNESALRDKEGLAKTKGWYASDFISEGKTTITRICENGIYYDVDVENGQKTGFFLDQKFNRLAVANIARGKKVLDCFTHTGSFALNAAKGGAKKVSAVDVSSLAVETARENAVKNNLADSMDFICADVFDLLPKLCDEHADYDMVILDPPAFTKSRKTIDSATRGYKEINYRAMRLLPRGGILATCSCSHFMSDEMFRKMLLSAASDAGVGLKCIEFRHQGPDHPILLSVPETDYLKFYLFMIV